MLSLHEIQRDFVAAVVEHGEVALCDWIVAPSGLDATGALEVYRKNVFGNYRNALQDTYPVVLRLVGKAFFNHAADVYLSSHPSWSGDLNDFGDAFDGFLEAWAPAGELTYLPDVARLEWAIHRVFHAADAPPFELQALAGVRSEGLPGLHFELHPATRLVRSAYPILRIWQVNQSGFSGDQTVELNEGPDQLLVIRRGTTVEVEAVSDGEWTMLEAFGTGASLEQAHARAVATEPCFDLGAFLRHHVLGGTLVAFRSPTEK